VTLSTFKAASQRTNRAIAVTPHQTRNGTGKIRFRRGIIFVALPLWMRTQAQSLASMGRLSGRQMAETAGRFRSAVQHKICGLFPSKIQTREQPWAERVESAEKAPFSERPMVAIRG